MRTSGWTPRAIFVQEAQAPHASAADGEAQFINCASATAARRLPTPSGPPNIRLGGREARRAARAVSSRSRRCPARSRNGMMAVPNPTMRIRERRMCPLLRRPAAGLPGISGLFLVFSDPENSRPEAALLLRFLLRGGG